MSELAITPLAPLGETLERVKAGVVPAIVGLLGAVAGLYGLTVFLAPASIPMSVVGIALGRRSQSGTAILAGACGIALAIAGLLDSNGFWLAFAAAGGALAVLQRMPPSR